MADEMNNDRTFGGEHVEDVSDGPASNAAARLKALTEGNFLLVGLVIAGIAGVYFLSLRTGPVRASAQEMQNEQKVETALLVLGDEQQDSGPADAASIVDTFYYEAQRRQIPLEQLQGNPFILDTKPEVDPSTLPSAVDQKELAERKRKAREAAQARESIDKLTLESVLADGADRIAVISGGLYMEGQKVEGWTVRRIGKAQVLLKWNGNDHVLKMPG